MALVFKPFGMAWCLAAMLLGTPTGAYAGKWECRTGSGGEARLLAFKDGIQKGEYDRFRIAFNQCFPPSYAGQRTLDLNSGGGSVVEALAIARAIVGLEKGPRAVSTQVSKGSVCISACTYLFVSGRLRNVLTGGSFEPHGFSSFQGMRIDEAIQAIKAPDGSLQWEKLDLQYRRLSVLAAWLPELARGDNRLAFAASWVGEFAQKLHKDEVTLSDLRRLAERFLELSKLQREFVQNVDAIVRSAIPELERVAALKGFETVLVAAGSSPVALDESRYFQWVVGEFELAANAYLRAVNDKGPVVLGDEFLRSVLSTQRDRAAEVISIAREQLGVYLESRSDQIDVAGLVKLMFSVSILYTRPLTREELCDLNIVNRDCAN